MHPSEEGNGIRSPGPETDPAAVREQLDRILASASFRNSKRHSGFLRYVIDETLNGRAAQLKERTVGVHVFGLDPDFDSGVNPLVRVSAGELRKRVAQYYHEPGRENELRIDLPPGSYVPEFRPAGHAPAPEPARPVSRTFRLRSPVLTASIFPVILLAGLAIWLWPWAPRDAYTQFWKPVWDSPGTAVISIPGWKFEDPTGRRTLNQVALSDSIALASLTPVLKSGGKSFRVLTQSKTTLADLKGGPSILIGAFSNELTLRLMGEARFIFGRDPETNAPCILDRQNPSGKHWQADRDRAESDQPYTDYAIISRVLNPATDRVTVVAAGLLGNGTLAAAEFLSNPAFMAAIGGRAPKRWESKNVQVVITMEVNHSIPGPPRVIATYFW